MSRIKLLLDVVEDIRSLADSLQAVADAMLRNETEQSDAPAEGEPDRKAGKKNTGKRTAKPAEEANPEPSESAEPPLTLEQVRAVLAEKSRAGHTAEVKALLTKHGADKLSDIDPAEYPALLADAEVL